ncbi:UDP-2-acetamido-2,6-beta-L-arabino-hexul-4-ose reductase [Pleionea litopenaei]|uniref:NAD-dependent epimerase/dehydratase family protein n=1 Tax=Pleionea litopenaei TaxID=3070815 RepID=A0AA51X6X1_9GAMM|nr:NAD-dependent epimerase/dehydratase family protein [Pleionea sp. HL-JVS1]WMS87281.1 NAD-dependent epimerase/dehydratase family protein [Pleionea sp. HL-JVS1]
MKALVTGHKGFIGKNLMLKLAEQEIEAVTFGREDDTSSLKSLVKDIDIIFHLAGVNRPLDNEEFYQGNTQLTEELCKALKETSSRATVVFTSSIQAELDNDYGKSKAAAEALLEELSESNLNPILNYRLPNIFGKWCQPNYNSFVATFCNNIANNIDITIHDSDAKVNLTYIDDLLDDFSQNMSSLEKLQGYKSLSPSIVYSSTVGEVADAIRKFKDSRKTLVTESVGNGFNRALYATFLSYYPTHDFSYGVPLYGDERGMFAELVKTKDSGQFSFFTAGPGVTRGGHYHHTKNEKFIVVSGQARFGFRHMVTGEKYYLEVSSEKPQVVETIPGWSHDITNIGSDDMIVLLWANEIFDRNKPDTVASKV